MAIGPPPHFPRPRYRPPHLSDASAHPSAARSRALRVASGRNGRAPCVQDACGGRVDDARRARGRLRPHPRRRGRLESPRLAGPPAAADHCALVGLPALSRSHGAAESVFAPGDYLLPLRGPRRAAARRRDERRRDERRDERRDGLGGPGARTPWDPMGPLPVASGCGWSGRARLQGALGWRACRPHTASAACARCGSAAAAHASPRGTPTHPAACACADRRARCSRCSRAAGTARRPSSTACALGSAAAGGRAASVRVRVLFLYRNLYSCATCAMLFLSTCMCACTCSDRDVENSFFSLQNVIFNAGHPSDVTAIRTACIVSRQLLRVRRQRAHVQHLSR